ncbi:hypothetical protein [Mycolicibacterium fortuitum]|uniref:Uncharacterized protein n=2 Tax=Mycolicibacterium fortuitum TaxID=1766 RepID=A0AAE4VHS0_MYCFO|nr:hypothetical protein [Mycolicibacterium fortuitum]MCV7137934.1 hypothetical protein [Mycolicibacterium fortuitum]MDV7194501.1 hypothetical protein [Mycolicibacterium fortuitum]MDV7207870.1 hypothetical protein [Mycolicibacterium fortuitum]MDV7229167.1 hypothetical protein [Mycolicibacterium fortuitum]MDV7260867.1 hypothetical protein [Mycolicibacterium fortuitum]
MEGNHPIEAPPGPPTPWPPHYPPANQARRWLPVAIIVAAIIIATAAISAVLLSRDTNTAAPAPTQVGGPAQAGTAETSSTCDAWPSTKAALNAIPQLPPGWDWSTPNIDTYIGNRTTAISRALDLFEPEISAEPASVAETASKYVTERRNEIKLLREHTYTQADGIAATAASARLDQLCGVR